jgi:hypothetical protein
MMTKRPRKPKLVHWLLLPVVLGYASALPVHSQAAGAATSVPSDSKPQVGKEAPQSSDPVPQNPAEAAPEASPEELRQAQIEVDIKRLYQLSAELRAEVAKTYKESLSLTVLKKAEEIEKLARSLKVLMNQEAAAVRH